MDSKNSSLRPRNGAIPSVRKSHEGVEHTLVDAKPLGYIAERERLDRAPLPKLPRVPRATHAPVVGNQTISSLAPPPNVIPFAKPATNNATMKWVGAQTIMAPPPAATKPTPSNMTMAPPPMVQMSAMAPTVTAAAVALAAPQMATPVAVPAARQTGAKVIPITPITPIPAITDAPADSTWSEFEELGLKPQSQIAQKASKLVVNVYRVLGFSILTIIVIVLVGYIAMTTFYYFSDSWVVPQMIQPSDEKVVSLQAQLNEQQNARDKIAAELAQAERAIVAQKGYEAEFAKSVRSDLEGRRAALLRLRDLAAAARGTRNAIKASNAAYAAAQQKKMADEYAAGLVDRNGMLAGKFQLAQITSSNLSLAERQAEFETKAAELEAQTRSLDAILADVPTQTPLSYDVLRIKQEHETSKLVLAQAAASRDVFKAALERQDQVVAGIKRSSYLKAIADGATVAFVPYGNLKNVSPKAPLYTCRVGIIICHKVGEVIEVLPGEVSFRHPHRDKMIRGQMVEMRLTDGNAAEDDVMFVGGRPLLF